MEQILEDLLIDVTKVNYVSFTKTDPRMGAGIFGKWDCMLQICFQNKDIITLLNKEAEKAREYFIKNHKEKK